MTSESRHMVSLFLQSIVLAAVMVAYFYAASLLCSRIAPPIDRTAAEAHAALESATR